MTSSPVETPGDPAPSPSLKRTGRPLFCTARGASRVEQTHDACVLRDAQAATYAADGFARTSDDPAVVLTLGTAEALEAASGLLTGWSDKLPVVALNVLEPENFSTLEGPYGEVTDARIVLRKKEHLARLNSLPAAGDMSGPRQVVCAPEVDVNAVLTGLSDRFADDGSEAPAGGADDVDGALLDRLLDFERPAIVLGRGGLSAVDPRSLRELSVGLDAPVLLTAGATAGGVEARRALRDAFEESGEGLLIPSGNMVWVKVLLFSDAALALGTGLSEADWFGMSDLTVARGPVFQVTTQPDPVDVGQTVVSADAGAFVERLRERLGPGEQRGAERLAYWEKKGRDWREHLSSEAERCRTYDSIEPRLAIRAIVDHAPDDAVFVGEGGSNGMWLWASLWLDDLVFPAQQATIGATIPMALGAKRAFPDRSLWCVVGDGAFFYHAEELETAAEAGVPLVVFVFNDHAWSSIRLAQTYMLHTNYVGTDLPDRVDYAEYAALLGCETRSARTPDGLVDAVDVAAGYEGDRPLVVNVDMKKDHVPFHGANFVLAELDGTLTSLIGPSITSFPKALWKGTANWDTLRSVLGALW